MKTTIIISTIWIISVGLNIAQPDSVKTKKIAYGFYFGDVALVNDFSRVNNVLVPLGYPELRNGLVGFSFGSTRRPTGKKSYSVFNLSFLNSLSNNYQPTIKDASLSMIELYIGSNLDLIKHSRWMVYPYFGEGIGFATFTLYDNLAKQSFAASAANLASPQTKTWVSFNLFFNAGFGFERKFKIWFNDFSIGLSGGYRATLSRFNENIPPYSEGAPISLSGAEINFRIRFEISELRTSKKQKTLYDSKWVK